MPIIVYLIIGVVVGGLVGFFAKSSMLKGEEKQNSEKAREMIKKADWKRRRL